MPSQETIRKNEAAMVKSSEPASALSVVHEGASEETPAHPPNLSPQGMFINTAEPFSVGAMLQLNVRLVGSGCELNARGKVCHCMPGVGVGVEFVNLSPVARRAIEEEIKATVSIRSGRR